VNLFGTDIIIIMMGSNNNGGLSGSLLRGG